jgi:RNA polymerase-binding transcription factor DksA
MSLLQKSKKLLFEKSNSSVPVICKACGFELELSRRDAKKGQRFTISCSCGHETEFTVETVLDPKEDRTPKRLVYQVKRSGASQLVRTY